MLFTNNDFHNTGVPTKGLPIDVGRPEGVKKVLADESTASAATAMLAPSSAANCACCRPTG